MDVAQEVLAANAAYADTADPPRPRPPARRTAVVTCMDARIDPLGVLGLRTGDAHVLRNAGGVVTDDTIRSLALSQWLLGTRVVLLMHHTECSLETLDAPSFRQQLYETSGHRPPWNLQAFTDLDASVRESIRRITTSPHLRHRDQVHGFVLDLATSRLRPVG